MMRWVERVAAWSPWRLALVSVIPWLLACLLSLALVLAGLVSFWEGIAWSAVITGVAMPGMALTAALGEARLQERDR